MQQIIDEIHAYIVENGAVASNWYVGIASDPRNRLFSQHNVREKGDLWIYSNAGNAVSARTIEKAFLDWGTTGGTGGGDTSTVWVYAYQIDMHTRE